MIRQDEKTKKWYVQVEYKDKITGKYRTHKKRGFDLKREASSYEQKFIENVNTTSVKFIEIASEYIKSINARDEQKHKKEVIINKYATDLLDLDFSKITKPILVAWSNKIRELNISYSTKSKIIGAVKSIYSFANKVYDLPNISSCIDSIKKTSNDLKEMQVWTIDEFNKFINEVDLIYYKGLFYTLFWTGLRRGEALALQVEDFKNGALNINKAIKHFENGFQPLKNTASKRIVKLDDKCIEIIKTCIDGRKSGFIFGNERSLGITNVQREFVKAIKKANVKKIRLHDLRHSHATILINNDVNIVAVSKRLGHTDINTTLSTYTHLLTKSEEELIEKLNNLK